MESSAPAWNSQYVYIEEPRSNSEKYIAVKKFNGNWMNSNLIGANSIDWNPIIQHQRWIINMELGLSLFAVAA